ncbi:MAG: endonuclease/exonuclease/phosphatase family protein, partial [Pseudomonas sp.]
MSTPESSEATREPLHDSAQRLLDGVNRFTVLTVNTHKGFTALNRRFILPELREAVRSVSADVVFLQEVHGTHEHHPQRYSNWPSIPQYEFLADTLWPQFAYGRNAVYPAGDHGNALLSKFQIIRHDNLDVSISGHESRGMLHSVLRLPNADGGQDVHAICVHLGLREGHRVEQL